MCWDCNYIKGGDPYKDFIHGKVDPDDFEVEFNYQTRLAKKGGSKKKSKTRPGCPENNYKAHVYVWTSELMSANHFYKFFGYHKYEREVCAGCGKKRRQRLTERYENVKRRKWNKIYGDGADVPRGEPIGRRQGLAMRKPAYEFWSWENEHNAWREYKKEVLSRTNTSPWQIDFTGKYEGWF